VCGCRAKRLRQREGGWTVLRVLGARFVPFWKFGRPGSDITNDITHSLTPFHSTCAIPRMQQPVSQIAGNVPVDRLGGKGTRFVAFCCFVLHFIRWVHVSSIFAVTLIIMPMLHARRDAKLAAPQFTLPDEFVEMKW
jgi:hypothetical protein